MGSGASVEVPLPEHYLGLTEESKQKIDNSYRRLLKEGKSHDDAVNILTKHYIFEGPTVVELTNLLHAIEIAVAHKKTPLIIDPSEDHKVDTFFSYRSAVMLDGKKMGLDKSMKHIPVMDIMEEARKKLVTALKFGYPFVIAMSNSVTDFAQTFNDTSCGIPREAMCFPMEALRCGGKELLQEEYMNGLFREEDKESGFAHCRSPATFQVILTSTFQVEDYEEYLFGNDWGLPKPIESYQVIIIKDRIDAAALESEVEQHVTEADQNATATKDSVAIATVESQTAQPTLTQEAAEFALLYESSNEAAIAIIKDLKRSTVEFGTGKPELFIFKNYQEVFQSAAEVPLALKQIIAVLRILFHIPLDTQANQKSKKAAKGAGNHGKNAGNQHQSAPSSTRTATGQRGFDPKSGRTHNSRSAAGEGISNDSKYDKYWAAFVAYFHDDDSFDIFTKVEKCDYSTFTVAKAVEVINIVSSIDYYHGKDSSVKIKSWKSEFDLCGFQFPKWVHNAALAFAKILSLSNQPIPGLTKPFSEIVNILESVEYYEL
jgi:hypothetical protein